MSLEVNSKLQKIYVTHVNFYFVKEQLQKFPKNLTGSPWHTFNQLAPFSGLLHSAALSHLHVFPRSQFAYLYQRGTTTETACSSGVTEMSSR